MTPASHPTPAFTDDRLLDGRVIVRQPAAGYRAAVDPVLLAAAVKAKAGQTVLDAGCGTGAAMFCLAARVPGLALTGIELQPALAAFARDGVTLNNFDTARVVVGDIANPPPDFREAFDIVITNPPYGDTGTPPPDASLAVAHMESDVDVAAWIAACLACLKPKGRLVMIHRADRLSDILAALHKSAGDIRILPIFSKAGAPARRVIVDAGKGRKSPDTLHPGLVLHEAGGGFTSLADGILRGAEISA
jgi:tRNA1(Val) A37 N6-methylase TrmN6